MNKIPNVICFVFAAVLMGAVSCRGPKLPPIDEAAVQERRDAVAAFEPEMLAHWTFDTPFVFGSREYDRSGQNIDGITRWRGQRSAGGVTWKPSEGIRGGAGFIAGSSRGGMFSEASFRLPSSWTLSVWYKPEAGKPDGVGDYNIVYMLGDQDNKQRFSLGQRGGWGVNFNDGAEEKLGGLGTREVKRQAGQWHHLAVVVANETVSFFINGKKMKAEGKLSAPIDSAVRLGMAGRVGAPHHKPGGHYDELRIYPSALSDKKVAALADANSEMYQQPLPPRADAGIGYTARLRDGWSQFDMQGRVAFGEEDVEYLWEVVEQPETAKARFADPLDPQTSFHTDSPGDYVLQLSVLGEAGVDWATVKAVVFPEEASPEHPALHSVGDGHKLAAFGYEPTHPQRAERLKGQRLSLIQHWTLDSEKTGSVQGRHGKAMDLRQLPGKTLDLGCFPALKEEFSLSFWVLNAEQLHGGNLVRAVGDDGGEYWKAWYRHNKNKVSTDSVLFYKWYQGTGMVPTGDWVHIVLTYSENGTVRKLYVNGQQTAWEKEGLGDASGDPRLLFQTPCLLDDIALYGTTLNTEEVLALYRNEGDASTVTDRIPADPYQTLAYSREQMERYFQDPEPKVVKDDLAVERFGVERLAPYMHPRLNFTLEDLPRIRRLARESEAGHNNYAFVTLYPAAAFGWEQERYSPNATVVEKDGKTKVSVDSGQGASSRICLAYKALLEADTRLARILIDGMMQSAKLQRQLLKERLRVRNDWREGYHDVLGRRVTPQMYDYLYNWMTEEERSVLRGIIADATAGKYSVGMYGVPAHNAHISNWQPWITGELFIALESIYGEEGFDPRAHQAAGRALALTASNMNGPEDGAHFEGMGKSNIGASQLSVLARTQSADEKIVASSAMFHHLTRFRFHAGLPWDHSRFMTDEKLGGLKNAGGPALNVLHYAYPDNPILNYLKRLQNEDATEWSGWNLRAFGQESWLYTAPYVQEWMGPEDAIEHLAQATANVPTGYFSHFRGQMISRDRWHADAVQLMFMPRVIRGGHWQPCRGYFRLNAFGREWLTFRSFASHEKAGWIPARNSIVTVDGDGQDVTTARLLHYEGAAENPAAVFDICTADLTGSYRHSDDAWATMNATRLKPDDRAWFDAPKGLLPQSLNAFRPSGSGPITLEGIDLKAVPPGQKDFEFAYRTAVFARGKYPYILILDDLKKDNEIREYTWNAALPKDLYGATGHSIAGERALLVDPEQSDRRCLVQMFSHDGEGSFAITPVYSRKEQKDLHYKNLTFTTKGAHQRFRALIYPHREGAPMPVVKGNGNSFTITIGDQVDELTVTRDARGRPQVEMLRK